MMRYHVCKHCFGIIRQWNNWGWGHVDLDWFAKCGKVPEPDYPDFIPRPNPSLRFTAVAWFLVIAIPRRPVPA